MSLDREAESTTDDVVAGAASRPRWRRGDRIGSGRRRRARVVVAPRAEERAMTGGCGALPSRAPVSECSLPRSFLHSVLVWFRVTFAGRQRLTICPQKSTFRPLRSRVLLSRPWPVDRRARRKSIARSLARRHPVASYPVLRVTYPLPRRTSTPAVSRALRGPLASRRGEDRVRQAVGAPRVETAHARSPLTSIDFEFPPPTPTEIRLITTKEDLLQPRRTYYNLPPQRGLITTPRV